MFQCEHNICSKKRLPDMTRGMMVLFGIPKTGCPVRNQTYCASEKDAIEGKSVKNVISMFRGSPFQVEARLKHDNVKF